MKKLFSFLLLFFVTSLMLAQNRNTEKVFDTFRNHYNAGKFDDIFKQFSPEMQQAMPLETTKQFFSGLKNQMGAIENSEFKIYDQNYALYKVKFEKMILAVNISVDHQDKISGLLVKPYEEPKTANSAAANRTVNGLKDFPAKISEAVFSKTKDFPENTQVSIAFIENGKTQFFGIIKKNDTVKSIRNQDEVFEIGSLTKVFTATVLASLAVQKKLNLKDNINSYYAFPFKNDIRLSFESLANHTSGLPRLPENLDLSDEKNPYRNYGKAEIEKYLKNGLHIENAGKYDYSNLGAGLLGYTLGVSQKTSFEELLRKTVFAQYKMNNSYTSSANLNDRLVKGLDKEGKAVPTWDFDVLFGAGGMLSTTEDLSKFVLAQFNPQNAELALTRKPTYAVNDQMKIGLGWHILKQKNSSETFWHNGGTGGYSSSLAFDVAKKNAVIILSNVSAFSPEMKNIDALCFELMNKAD